MDAKSDVAYSSALLKSYAIAMLAALGFAGVVQLRPRVVLWMPFAVLVYVVMGIIFARPEEPVVLFPTMLFVWLPAVISVAATSVAAVLHCVTNHLW